MHLATSYVCGTSISDNYVIKHTAIAFTLSIMYLFNAFRDIHNNHSNVQIVITLVLSRVAVTSNLFDTGVTLKTIIVSH